MQVTVRAGVEIAAPAEKIYPYVADLMKHDDWSKGAIDMKANGDGTYESHTHLLGKAITATVRVVADEAPKHFAFDVEEPNGTIHHDFTLTSRGSGTYVERAMTLPEMKGIGGWFFKTIFAPTAVKSDTAATMKRLKKYVESR